MTCLATFDMSHLRSNPQLGEGSAMLTTYVSPASLRYTEDAEDTLGVLARQLVLFIHSFFSMSSSKLLPHTVRTGKALFPVCSYWQCRITHTRSHCECHCLCLKPPNYARCTKNRPKKDDLQHCQSLQPSTTVPYVTSQRTGKSPVLMTLLITKSQI